MSQINLWKSICLHGLLISIVLLIQLDKGLCQVVFDDTPQPASGPARSPFQFQIQTGGGNRDRNFGNNNGNGFGSGNNQPGAPPGFGSNQGNQGGFGGGNQGNQGGFGGGNQGNQNQQGFGTGNERPGAPPGFGGNQGFNNQNQFEKLEQQQQLSSRQPDCRTFHNDGGFCTPLQSCERIGRMLRNRNPVAAARLLRRSICGFSTSFVPNVCCPQPRNEFQDNNLDGINSTPPPFSPVGPIFTNRPFVPSTTAVAVTIRPTFPSQTLAPQQQTPPPAFTTGSSGLIGDGSNGNNGPLIGVTLVPPKTTTIGNGGGGLIIIGGGSNPTSPAGLSAEGLPADCGVSNAPHNKIVGGHEAQKGAYPWIAVLGYKDEAGNVNYLCGGALISKDFVATASHCVNNRKDLYSVRLGDHDIFSNADGVTPLEIEVAEAIKHPQYDPATFHNDIALIRLKNPVPFTPQIHPICLPSSKALRTERFLNNSPFVAGWGAIQFNGPSSSVLREVQVPIVDDSVCQEKFKSFKSVNVDDSNICAGLQAGGKDACQGDSGGPLMQPVGGGSRYVLIGIVSFGFKCAEPGYPGVYSRVTSHLDWIQKTIQGTS